MRDMNDKGQEVWQEALCRRENMPASVLHFRAGTMADLRKGRFYLMEKHLYDV